MPQGVRESSSIVKVAAATVVVAGLSFGSPILVPIALAILLSFAVAPLVSRLERWHFGRVGSVVTVVLLGVALAAGTVFLVAGQAADLATQLPKYRGNLSKKFEIVRSLERKWTSAAGELARASKDPEPDSAGSPGKASPAPPAAPADSPTFMPFKDGAERSIELGLACGGVLILMIFILLQRDDLHARALRVAGGGRYGVTSQALNETAEKVSRYLLAELALNTLYGVVITLGLLALGIPNPFVWGLLCGLLRFVPYIGPIVAAAMPIGMSLAVSPNWTLPLATIGLFVGVELIVNNVIEPLVHGRSTGLSPVAILASAAFWTWLWGPVGLILSTPLTVCLYVLGKHYPPLHFFHVLMGQEVDKSLAARLYPRLLSSDHDAAWEIVAAELKHSELAEVFDATLVPALELVKRNRFAGELDLEESRRIVREVDEITDETCEAAKPSSTSQAESEGEVICVPTKDDEDAACCRMLACVMGQEGIPTRTFLPDEVTALAGKLRTRAVFCLLDVRTSSPRRLQLLADRLRKEFPEIPLVAARLPANGPADAAPAPAAPLLHRASTLEECREVLKRLLAPVKAPVVASPPGEVALPVTG